jgi:phosphatidylserine/phosphatidylglycerophosphate/cardiolipin synthase-like enzyme
MHNKFIIRDGLMLETGSFNFTNHATLANNENQIYLDKPEVVARYVERFNQIWERAKPAALLDPAPATTGPETPESEPAEG